MNRMIPIHLEGYDINKLADWAAQSPERKRNAVLSTWELTRGTIGFTVRLSWTGRDNAQWNVWQTEMSAQEAVFRALEKFKAANLNGEHD